MKTTTRTEAKVLPFDTARGHVEGHAIERVTYDWMKEPILYVAFSTFSTEAGMRIQTLVHWTEFTKYVCRMWPAYGEVKAVILGSGCSISATSMSVVYPNNAAYEASPLVARSCHRIVTLQSHYPLLEVVGVESWARAGRKNETLILDPWARDNAAYEQRVVA